MLHLVFERAKANRMSKKINYQEYTISSTPVPLLGRGEWTPEIVISSEREGIVTWQPYADETTYPTEEAADNHGITLGQDILDGKVPELSCDSSITSHAQYQQADCRLSHILRSGYGVSVNAGTPPLVNFIHK